MDKKYKKEKRVFEKHKQKLYKNGNEIIQSFRDRVLAKKKRPLREAGGQKTKFLKNPGKGDIKKGPAKGTEKEWSWMVSLYRPWQDPIGQGHGEWNGNREKLYPSLSAMPRAHPSWPKW